MELDLKEIRRPQALHHTQTLTDLSSRRHNKRKRSWDKESMSSINPIDIVPHWRDVAKGVTKSSKKKDAAEKKEAFEKKDTVEKKYASK